MCAWGAGAGRSIPEVLVEYLLGPLLGVRGYEGRKLLSQSS